MQTAGRGSDVRVYPDPEMTCAALAEALAEVVGKCLGGCHRFTLALCGGETPRMLYEILAQRYRDSLPWEKIHFFWGDDRFVPHDDPLSNYKLVRETLLQHVPVPQGNVHPMPTFFKDSEQAAAEYEATLKEYFHGAWPHFDVALQGLGLDGHTASLFPHSPALRRQDRWVLPVDAPTEQPRRLTLTFPALNHAARVWFLVRGAAKKQVLAKVLDENAEPDEYPAAGIKPEDGELVWWVDAAAAGGHLRSASADLPSNRPPTQ
jgi:6-phosphogluconolactonase